MTEGLTEVQIFEKEHPSQQTHVISEPTSHRIPAWLRPGQ